MFRLLPLLCIACAATAPAETGEPVCEPTIETCNGRDDDCDGQIDEDAEDASTWYVDDDGDGWGDSTTGAVACAYTGRVDQAGDCDDGDDGVRPGANERCNDVDDDCDGEVDEDAEDAGRWYPDADGDGFGDESAAPEVTCDEATAGWVADDSDCDDTDEAVHPDAVERCNGIDDDCSALSTEAATAWFERTDGTWEDWTAPLKTGSEGEPITRVIRRPGTLWLCPRTWYASLRLRSSVRVQGVGDPGTTRLSGGSQRPVVVVRTDGIDVAIDNIGLREGKGAGALFGEFTAGGGVECDATDTTLHISDVHLRDSQADVGAGVFSRGCALTIERSEISENLSSYAGGGLTVIDAEAHLTATEIEDNTARYGGGIATFGIDTDTTALTLTDSTVAENYATYHGGGLALEDARVSCRGEAGGAFGVYANEAAGGTGGGAVLWGDALLVSETCTWGESTAGDDNSPHDVSSDTDFTAGDDASFSCTTTECTR